jgi:hypothetical protein
MLVLFNVQVSASAVKSCSQMTMQQVEESPHQMMDHSLHDMMSSTDISINDNQNDKQVSDCCDDNCLCDIASGSYSSSAHHSTEHIIPNNFLQTKILFIAFAHQTQFLNYLFKPPIQIIS